MESVADDFEVNDHWDVVNISETDQMLLSSRRRALNQNSSSYRKALGLAEAMVAALDLGVATSFIP